MPQGFKLHLVVSDSQRLISTHIKESLRGDPFDVEVLSLPYPNDKIVEVATCKSILSTQVVITVRTGFHLFFLPVYRYRITAAKNTIFSKRLRYCPFARYTPHAARPPISH